MISIELYDHQASAIEKMHNGCILCGGVGSGKSRTSLAYYFNKECMGNAVINGKGVYRDMFYPRDLYIITTAQKRDKGEWLDECVNFLITPNSANNPSGIKLVIDSWNNIKKYDKVNGAFFIFDEQRVVGRGAWVKAFLNITRKNHWILLSATPGDTWSDYIPVFVANGFYKNRTQFNNEHAVWNRFSKYPKIDRYINEAVLMRYRKQVLVDMHVERDTVQHHIACTCDYDKALYRRIFRDRWDIYENEPITEAGKLCYLLRKLVNNDPSRLEALSDLLMKHERTIIFYNFTSELEQIKKLCDTMQIPYGEWNGQKHTDIPDTKGWAYLVQYNAGSEGWNCTTTDTIIFYSQTYSYRMSVQAAGRIDRINTSYVDLYYYHLKSTAPIDLAIARALRQKKNFNAKNFVSF